MEITRGCGKGLKAKTILKESIKLNWNFGRGAVVGANQEPSKGRKMDIFWINTAFTVKRTQLGLPNVFLANHKTSSEQKNWS